jgi:peptidoglycan/xylan/chitin deacetylase (PgdA/CDA1 family)
MASQIGLQLLKMAAATADVMTPRRRGVVVLLYHRVGTGSGSQVDLPLGLFRDQLERLAASGRVSTLDAAVAQLGLSDPPAVDPIVVTFDDGTPDFVDTALPVLVEVGVPATLYLATDFVERQRPFPGSRAPLSWAALVDAVATGLVTIGSHTDTHCLLDRTPPNDVGADLDRSIELIGDRLGVEARHFAYPKAVTPSPEAEALVRSRFVSAALAGMRPNPYGRTDLHRLARSPVQVSDGTRWFDRKAAGGMWLEATARDLLNRRRYVGATE